MRIKVSTLVVTLFMALSSACGGGSGDSVTESPAISSSLEFERVQNMPAGFQLFGAHGVMQIDGQYANLGLTAKGAITIPPSGSITPSTPMVSQIAPQISVKGITPIVCLRPTVVNATIARVQRSGDVFNYTVIGSASASGETFQYFVFDQMRLAIPLSNSKGGMQVFTPDGNIVFDSNANPMRVIAVGSVPSAPLLTTPGALSAPSPGVYAACISQGRIDSIYSPPSRRTQIFGEGVRITANGAVTDAVPNNFVGYEIHPRENTGAQIILVDVSGL